MTATAAEGASAIAAAAAAAAVRRLERSARLLLFMMIGGGGSATAADGPSSCAVVVVGGPCASPAPSSSLAAVPLLQPLLSLREDLVIIVPPPPTWGGWEGDVVQRPLLLADASSQLPHTSRRICEVYAADSGQKWHSSPVGNHVVVAKGQPAGRRCNSASTGRRGCVPRKEGGGPCWLPSTLPNSKLTRNSYRI